MSYTGKSLVSRLVLVGLWMYLKMPSDQFRLIHINTIYRN